MLRDDQHRSYYDGSTAITRKIFRNFTTNFHHRQATGSDGTGHQQHQEQSFITHRIRHQSHQHQVQLGSGLCVRADVGHHIISHHQNVVAN